MASKADWQAAAGKGYRTRNGESVRIERVDEVQDRFPVVGILADGTRFLWDLDGKCAVRPDLDLMEVETRP